MTSSSFVRWNELQAATPCSRSWSSLCTHDRSHGRRHQDRAASAESSCRSALAERLSPSTVNKRALAPQSVMRRPPRGGLCRLCRDVQCPPWKWGHLGAIFSGGDRAVEFCVPRYTQKVLVMRWIARSNSRPARLSAVSAIM
jgi:hypothetical protein